MSELTQLPIHIEHGVSADGSEYAYLTRCWKDKDNRIVTQPAITVTNDPELLLLCKIVAISRERIGAILDGRES